MEIQGEYLGKQAGARSESLSVDVGFEAGGSVSSGGSEAGAQRTAVAHLCASCPSSSD
jgi:hypothetical protein